MSETAILHQLIAYNVVHPHTMWFIDSKPMVTKRAKRRRALDFVLELGIASAIVAVVVLCALFRATYAQASWVPLPDNLKQGAWLVGATGIGIAYVYSAYSTRRLKRLVADKPQLQPLIGINE